MDRRYKLMNWIGARNLSGYNHKVAERKIEDPFAQKPDEPQEAEILQPLPHIVVVIDELADSDEVGKKVEELIARLAGKARAAGIHPCSRPAPLGRRDHRAHQGQHPHAHRVPGFVQGRLAHHPGPVGRREPA